MRPALIALVMLVAAGCGAQEVRREATQEPSGLALRSVCPGLHVAVDNLVVSDPTSRIVFLDQVRRLRAAGTTDVRDTVAPLVGAAVELEAVKTDEDFFTARDDLHAAVVEVDAGCAAVGSPIQHSGPHPTG